MANDETRKAIMLNLKRRATRIKRGRLLALEHFQRNTGQAIAAIQRDVEQHVGVAGALMQQFERLADFIGALAIADEPCWRHARQLVPDQVQFHGLFFLVRLWQAFNGHIVWGEDHEARRVRTIAGLEAHSP